MAFLWNDATNVPSLFFRVSVMHTWYQVFSCGATAFGCATLTGMPQLTWKDSSSYSQGEKKGEPKSFEATTGRFRLIVSRCHLHNPGRWTMHIYPGLFDTFDMGGLAHVSVEEVQVSAEGLLRDRLLEALKGLSVPS